MFTKKEKILLGLVFICAIFIFSIVLNILNLMQQEYEQIKEQYDYQQTLFYQYHADNITYLVANRTFNYSNDILVEVTENEFNLINEQKKELEEEIVMLAKVLYQEARGMSKKDIAAVAWCVLNRIDYYDSSITKMIKVPGQFAWFADTPVCDPYLSIADDVVTRWLLEKQGKVDVGRVLPKDYRYFFGYNGLNYYTQKWQSDLFWDWSLDSPY